MTDSVRIVMLDPEWFGDVSIERGIFQDLLENVTVDSISDSKIKGEEIGSADILLTHDTGVSAEMMRKTGCSVVSRYATGIDGIDIEAANSQNVTVTRMPAYCNIEVGEHIITLALSVLRGLPQYTAATASGDWNWQKATPLRQFQELTFGFFAYGRKGKVAAKLANKLGFDTCAYDPYVDDSKIADRGVDPVSFEKLIDRSDIISVNAPLTEETRMTFNAEVFDRMKEDAVFINTGRGEIVDETALYNALEHNDLFGAGLDVLEQEPPDANNPLLHRDDVFVTPHAAWYSETSANKLRRQGSKVAVKAYHGESHPGVVNKSTL